LILISVAYIITFDWRLLSDWHLLDGAPAQRVPLSLRGKQSKLLLLVLAEVVAVPEVEK
jgi:hypothetical protein